jgi:hypothetical protein
MTAQYSIDQCLQYTHIETTLVEYDRERDMSVDEPLQQLKVQRSIDDADTSQVHGIYCTHTRYMRQSLLQWVHNSFD